MADSKLRKKSPEKGNRSKDRVCEYFLFTVQLNVNFPVYVLCSATSTAYLSLNRDVFQVSCFESLHAHS